MHLFLFIILAIVFFSINGMIIASDMKYKKIPNRELLFLLLLLPVFYAYVSVTRGFPVEMTALLLQVFVSVLLSFLLYYYGVWSAGDAKYLLILSLYLPSTGIIPFAGNLAIVTVAYLLGYYVYFYGKLFFRWTSYRNSFFTNIFTDQKDRFRTFLHNHGIQRTETKRTAYNILKFIITFFIFFVSIRLIRSYLVGDLMGMEIFHSYIVEYPTYCLFFVWGSFFLAFFALKKIFGKLRMALDRIIARRGYGIGLDLGFSLLLLLLLTGFIGYEYAADPEGITHRLFLIFTLYLAIFLIFKALFYSYRIVFHLSEQDTIPIDALQPGDIVDKEYLISLFWSQDSLGHSSWSNKNGGLFSPSPKDYFQNMENPIDGLNSVAIKKAFDVVNAFHKKNKTPGFEEIRTIRILRTFAFWGYIFVGFLMAYIWGEAPFRLIIQGFLSVFRLV